MNAFQQLYDAGQFHASIQQAHRTLAAQPHAPDLARLTLRLLVEQGLGGPARELLQLRTDLDRDDPAIRTCRDRLPNLPNGRVAWRKQSSLLERNLAALRRENAPPDEFTARIGPLLADVHLYRTASGGWQLSQRAAGELRQWAPDFTSLHDESSLHWPAHAKLGPTALVGVRFGNIPRTVCELTRNVFLTHSDPIYLIEPDEARFAAWLHVDDHSAWLADPRVFVFVGPDALEAFENALRDDAGLPLPGQFIRLSATQAQVDAARQATERVNAERMSELQRLVKVLGRRYGERDVDYWRDRWSKPARVMAITSRYTTVLQYSTRDALRALDDQGWETRAFKEQTDYHAYSAISVCRDLLEFDPDLLFIIDHLRGEYPYLPRNLPMLSWIQDPLPNLLNTQAGASIGPMDFVCGFYRERLVREFGYPAEQLCDALIPVSSHVFHAGEVPDEDANRYDCDLLYAGNIKTLPAELLAELRNSTPQTLHPLLASFEQEVARRLDGDELLLPVDAADVMDELSRRAGLQLPQDVRERLMNFGLLRLYDVSFREQTLAWIADWARTRGRTFRLYGHGWDQHPTLAAFAVGPAEHGEPLRRAYHSARLVLTTGANGYLHQRTHEALASGSLVVGRYTPNNFNGLSLEQFVEVGLENIDAYVGGTVFPRLSELVFRTPAELDATLERLLTDEPMRRALQRDCARIVDENFTYHVVMRDVLQQMKTALFASTPAPAQLAAAGTE